MYKKLRNIATLLLIIVILTSCSPSTEKELLKEVENTVETTFSKDKADANQETKEYSYRLPFSMKEVEQVENNIVLEKGKRTYVLFYDHRIQENGGLYKEEKEKDKEPLLLTKIDDSLSSFVKVVKLESDLYEITVGAGGVKVTTTSTKDNLLEQADLLSEIVHSFTFK